MNGPVTTWLFAGVLGLANLVLIDVAFADELRIAPGAPLQQAIDDAPDHATLILETGRHNGPITLSRPVTLIGQPQTWVVGTQHRSVITIDADDVVVKNLHVARSGRSLATDDAGVLIEGDRVRVENVRLSRNLHGIYVRGGEHVRLINNRVAGLAATQEQLSAEELADVQSHADDMHHRPIGTQELIGNGIHLWNADGAQVTDNHIAHVRDGIYIAHTHRSTFHRNRIHNARYGIHYMYSSDNALHDNILYHNVAGAALMFSRNLEVHGNILREHSGFRAYGLLLQDVESSSFASNQIRANRVGMRLQNSSANTFQNNQILGNLAGMTINPSSRNNAFTMNRIGPNLHQLEMMGTPPPTDWSVDGVGNHWHNAMALDLTGDGISNWPHHEVDLMAEQREAFPYVQLLTGSPGIQALQWVLSRAPIPGTRFITDPHPLIRAGEAAP